MLDDAAYNGDAAATAGAVLYQPGPDLDGDLALGATATITYSVTVTNPDTGDQRPGQHRDLGRGGQQLPSGGSRPAVRRHGARCSCPG